MDLEDKLIYGLTPTRFGYVVIAVLGAMALWRSSALPAALRLSCSVLLLLAGGVLAWGQWQGRALDRLTVDMVVFLRRNYCLEFRRGRAQPSGPAAPADSVSVGLAPINRLRRLRSSSP